ncbi:MAG: LysM peptidoglycan-binding domain-containing protein [Oscillatoriophycideae cyanobacterium NC_groundwater_1537_Pr4_S-0.65um_50_18]|nr:LysM peptidoglycan-binding domain-containing protein [Oscillatoriophycideae cyanobacterium NC_groundwater_1537_Pr4_S-0.65um_50_18]
MKREFLRKVKPVSCSPRETAGQPEQISAGVSRRARTSAAMFGLALSVGASSLVLPHHDDGVSAAETKGTETASPSLSQVATLPSSVSGSTAVVPSTIDVEHVVREGQTLVQIARSYRVNVQDIVSANDLDIDALLRPGQMLKIPVRQSTDSLKASVPEVVASADLNQLSGASENSALSRLREQRDKLKDSLAELRSEEVNRSVAEVSKGSTIASASETSVSIADKEEVAIASTTPLVTAPEASAKPTATYRVQPGDTLAAIARAHGVSEQTLAASNRLSDPDWIRVSDSLNVPAVQTIASSDSANPVADSQPVDGQPVNTPLAEVPSVPEAVQSPISQAPPSEAAIAQVPALQSPISQPPAQQVAIAPQMQDYRVGLGDTVARIAKAHNVPLSTLVSANRLSDPNVIFVGQVLRVPTASVSSASVPAPVEAPRPVVQAKPQTMAIAPRAAAGSSLTQPTPEVQGGSESPTAVQANSPRYVENLLAEVRALRAKHQGGTVVKPANQNSSIQPSVAQPETVQPEAVQSAAVQSPVMVTARREAPLAAASLQAVPQAVAPQAAAEPVVVATAPINSESYAPLRQSITGRTVSPELPSLSDADAFLPEGTSSNGYIWPTRGLLTSGYGWRWGRMHAGIDIAADTGTPIYAAATGVVQYSDWNSGGYGNLVEILHPDGSFTRYAHLNRSLVREGQRVRQGEQIAEMGSTGYSTGPHLHFEVHPKSSGAVNPMAYLPQQSAQ